MTAGAESGVYGLQTKCPICGDAGPFALWGDNNPPAHCPYSPDARNVTECQYQMRRARQRAEWLKLCPEAFDENGTIVDWFALAKKLPRDAEFII